MAEPSGREDLCTLVLAYLQGTVPHPPVDSAVNFYQAAKAAAVSLPLLLSDRESLQLELAFVAVSIFSNWRCLAQASEVIHD